MENNEEVKIELLNDVLCAKLILLLHNLDTKKGITALCLAIALGLFYNIPLISTNDNQAELDAEIDFLRMYNKYLYRMMYAEVWMAYNSGAISLDDRFSEPFLEKIENEDYSISSSVDYSVNFLKYYFRALKVNKKEVPLGDCLIRLRRIDPLYHNFWI